MDTRRGELCREGDAEALRTGRGMGGGLQSPRAGEDRPEGCFH